MAEAKDYVVCPLCYFNRLMNSEARGLVDFTRWDPKSSDLIQIRQGLGRTKEGKSQGFPKIDALTLHDAVLAGNSDYNKIIKQVKEQLLKILQAFYDEDIITKTELNSIK